MHRFLAMFLYIMSLTEENIIGKQFQLYMRSLDPLEAPFLFNNEQIEKEDVLLQPILSFCGAYKDIILEERDELLESANLGKWVLDLSITGLHSQLKFWGENCTIPERYSRSDGK